MIKINILRGDLSNVSAKTATLTHTNRQSFVIHHYSATASRSLHTVTSSVAVLAEISLRPPRKRFIFIIKKIYF